MAFQENPEIIQWRLNLRSSPIEVYKMLSTDAGRARFWAESAVEKNGAIHFLFPNGATWQGKILDTIPNKLLRLEYYGGSITTFELQDDGKSGTDLILTDRGVIAQHRAEVIAGWVSVLMALKAAVDFSIDLRTHDPIRTWEQGFVDN